MINKHGQINIYVTSNLTTTEYIFYPRAHEHFPKLIIYWAQLNLNNIQKIKIIENLIFYYKDTKLEINI